MEQEIYNSQYDTSDQEIHRHKYSVYESPTYLDEAVPYVLEDTEPVEDISIENNLNDDLENELTKVDDNDELPKEIVHEIVDDLVDEEVNQIFDELVNEQVKEMIDEQKQKLEYVQGKN